MRTEAEAILWAELGPARDGKLSWAPMRAPSDTLPFIMPPGWRVICEAALAALDAKGACDGDHWEGQRCTREVEHRAYRLLRAALELTRAV